MTPDQIKHIHVASTKAGLNRAQYEMLLRNVAGVESCKALTNTGFEDCMATLEDMGFPGTYWRDKIAARSNGLANARMVFKIAELYAEYLARLPNPDADSVYKLPGLIARGSHDRTRDARELTPREAWNLIESLKNILDRTPIPPSTPPDAATTDDPEIPF